jgi:hypothetical protein
LARWPTFAAVLARTFALHDGCHFFIITFLLLSMGYVIWRGGQGCGKLSTAEVVKWSVGLFCGEILALWGNFRLLQASSGLK